MYKKEIGMEMKDIIEQVEMIRVVAENEDEEAHALEDRLMVAFIEYVSTLELPVAKKAKKVLETRDISFSRWYA